MKYLIYEMFSGVGFCNQLFSLETAIYMANVSNRKLILLIKNPLCHCGNASWDFGYLLDYFSENYTIYLPKGIQIIYGRNEDQYLSTILNNNSITKHITYKDRFSNILFIDKDYDNQEEARKFDLFARGRFIEYLQFEDNDNYEYIYINQSNASRIFYNFYTNIDNVILMNNIAYSFTKLNPNISDLFSKISPPDKFIAIHLRFGDSKHGLSVINGRSPEYLDNIDFNKIKGFNLPVLVMCDRKDSDFLENFTKNNIEFTFVDKLIADSNISYPNNEYFSKFKRTSVVDFLFEKYVCEQSEIFIANNGSTVSNYINYNRFINNKPFCNLYSNIQDKTITDNTKICLMENQGSGRLLTWQCF